MADTQLQIHGGSVKGKASSLPLANDIDYQTAEVEGGSQCVKGTKAGDSGGERWRFERLRGKGRGGGRERERETDRAGKREREREKEEGEKRVGMSRQSDGHVVSRPLAVGWLATI